MLHRYAIGAWVNAVRLARAASQPDDTLADLLRTAYRFNGDDFVDDLSASIHEHEGELDTELPARLDAAVHDIDDARRIGGFTMRLPFEDGTIAEFEFIPGD